MAYIIDGPVNLGTTSSATTIYGNVILNDVSTTQGTIFYVGASGTLVGLPPGTNGQALTTQGTGANPIWTTAYGTDESFSAVKSGTQTGITTTPTIITTWTATGTAAAYNTGSFAPSTGIFTAGNTSKYDWFVNVALTQTANNGSIVVDLYYNGTTVIAQKTFQPNGNNSINQQCFMSGTLSLTAADTVVVRVHTTGTATLTVQASPETWFSMLAIYP